MALAVIPGAGQLRQRVSVLTSTTTDDALGQETTVWTAVATYWARVDFVGGKKIAYDGQVVDQVTHTVTMRYFGTLTPAARLSYDGSQLTILAIDNVNRLNLWYVIHCQELVGINQS